MGETRNTDKMFVRKRKRKSRRKSSTRWKNIKIHLKSDRVKKWGLDLTDSGQGPKAEFF